MTENSDIVTFNCMLTQNGNIILCRMIVWELLRTFRLSGILTVFCGFS